MESKAQMKEYSFKLLDASINAKMRIQHVLDSIRTWVLSDELRELLEAFDYTENLGTVDNQGKSG